MIRLAVALAVIGLLGTAMAILGFVLAPEDKTGNITVLLVGIVLDVAGIGMYALVSARAQQEADKAEAAKQVNRTPAAEPAALARARDILTRGCPKCQADLGIEPDSPMEKVQSVMSGRCFYCGADLRSAAAAEQSQSASGR